MNNIELLEQKLGYIFKNKDLLVKALTHSSASGTSNYERMEFLGDSLLGRIVAEHLYNNFNEEVGKMSVMRSNLVSTNALSKIVLENGWNNFIIVGASISSTKNIAKNVLADVFESITAAIYLDAGIDEARKFVNKFILSKASNIVNLDFKTLLQEKVASINPNYKLEYKLISSAGPSHATVFEMGLYFNGSLVSSASANSKKSAEQQCAQIFLTYINENGIKTQ